MTCEEPSVCEVDKLAHQDGDKPNGPRLHWKIVFPVDLPRVQSYGFFNVSSSSSGSSVSSYGSDALFYGVS